MADKKVDEHGQEPGLKDTLQLDPKEAHDESKAELEAKQDEAAEKTADTLSLPPDKK